MVTSDRELLAYLAGVMDSDGHIGIRLQRGTSTIQEVVQVGQTSTAAVSLCVDRWGGSLSERRRDPKWRPLFVWKAENRMAARCVAELRPWLRIKSRQADLLLAVRASKDLPRAETFERCGVRGRRLRPEVLEERLALLRAARDLNSRAARLAP